MNTSEGVEVKKLIEVYRGISIDSGEVKRYKTYKEV